MGFINQRSHHWGGPHCSYVITSGWMRHPPVNVGHHPKFPNRKSSVVGKHHLQMGRLPSGKHTKNYGKIHHS